MWYKINKLTTLAYPQWSQGTKVSNDGKNVFIQPFSQVIGASPLVRLRIGDLIKSNYSRFNLARIFGIGDPNIKTKPVVSSILGAIPNAAESFLDSSLGMDGDGIFDLIQEGIIKTIILAFGSPGSLLNIGGFKNVLDTAVGKTAAFPLGSALQENLVANLTNGFVNPLLESAIVNIIKSPNAVFSSDTWTSLAVNKTAGSILALAQALSGEPSTLKPNLINNIHKPTLLANTVTGYRTEDQRVLLISRATKISIISYENDTSIMYKVAIDDPNSKYNGEVLFCNHTDIYANPEYLFFASGIAAAFAAANGFESLLDESVNFAQENIQQYGFTPKVADIARSLYKKDEVLFMEPENNPFVRAYESTKGRGLAGVLSSLNFTWGAGEKYQWETDYNSRAPMGCKISMTLNVIHDIPPGLDHSGYNRAPIYNVGDVMRTISGDPYEDGGSMSKTKYDIGREDRKKGE